ncbi:hypothetical protein ACLB2K_004543 [Fragaria x ananassa]
MTTGSGSGKSTEITKELTQVSTMNVNAIVLVSTSYGGKPEKFNGLHLKNEDVIQVIRDVEAPQVLESTSSPLVSKKDMTMMMRM